MDSEMTMEKPKRKRGRPRKVRPADVAAAPPAPARPTIEIRAPYAGDAAGYQVRRLDCSLDLRQRLVLRLIYDGLQLEGETLRGGRPVVKTQDAVRWLLDQAADAIGLE